MPHCMVPKCTNGWRKTKGSGITYHRVPSGPLKHTWLQNIKRENLCKLNNSFVCSVHFTPDCFIAAKEICGRIKPKMLKPTAVPTLFEYAKKMPYPRASSLRQIREREVLQSWKKYSWTFDKVQQNFVRLIENMAVYFNKTCLLPLRPPLPPPKQCCYR